MRHWKDYGSTFIEIGDIEYDVSVIGLFTESEEGQDADGNRGELMTFLEGIKIEHVEPFPTIDVLSEITDTIYNLEINDISWHDGGGSDLKYEWRGV